MINRITEEEMKKRSEEVTSKWLNLMKKSNYSPDKATVTLVEWAKRITLPAIHLGDETFEEKRLIQNGILGIVDTDKYVLTELHSYNKKNITLSKGDYLVTMSFGGSWGFGSPDARNVLVPFEKHWFEQRFSYMGLDYYRCPYGPGNETNFKPTLDPNTGQLLLSQYRLNTKRLFALPLNEDYSETTQEYRYLIKNKLVFISNTLPEQYAASSYCDGAYLECEKNSMVNIYKIKKDYRGMIENMEFGILPLRSSIRSYQTTFNLLGTGCNTDKNTWYRGSGFGVPSYTYSIEASNTLFDDNHRLIRIPTLEEYERLNANFYPSPYIPFKSFSSFFCGRILSFFDQIETDFGIKKPLELLNVRMLDNTPWPELYSIVHYFNKIKQWLKQNKISLSSCDPFIDLQAGLTITLCNDLATDLLLLLNLVGNISLTKECVTIDFGNFLENEHSLKLKLPIYLGRNIWGEEYHAFDPDNITINDLKYSSSVAVSEFLWLYKDFQQYADALNSERSYEMKDTPWLAENRAPQVEIADTFMTPEVYSETPSAWTLDPKCSKYYQLYDLCPEYWKMCYENKSTRRKLLRFGYKEPVFDKKPIAVPSIERPVFEEDENS